MNQKEGTGNCLLTANERPQTDFFTAEGAERENQRRKEEKEKEEKTTIEKSTLQMILDSTTPRPNSKHRAR
ncbi:hypothetical protein HZA56_04415 [Candidatus Poribacteria bacterium]|nr:hypothetical protein [Candidatus Poribacteria bacterium]